MPHRKQALPSTCCPDKQNRDVDKVVVLKSIRLRQKIASARIEPAKMVAERIEKKAKMI